MLLFTKDVYLPPRTLFSGTVAGSPVDRLDHPGRVEEVGVESYDRHGVQGLVFHRSSGERVLVVSYRTQADPHDSVLLLPIAGEGPPGQEDLLASSDEAPEGYRWISPSPGPLEDQASMEVGKGEHADRENKTFRGEGLPRLSKSIRASWDGEFRFIEEEVESGEVVCPGLRPPQMGALHASLAHWKVTSEPGTIVMPTGTGKTETMLALYAREQLPRLLVVVPTAALRDQIAEKFLTMGVLPEFGILPQDVELPVVGRMEHLFDTPEEARRFQRQCNVVVATMAAIGQCPSPVRDALAEGCSHLFIDEAHHVPATTWSAFKERVRDFGRPILQYTATPYRRDGKHIGGKSVFTYPLRQAQEDGYFSPITFISIWEYNRNRADEAIAERATQALHEDLEAGHDHLLMARTERIERAREVHEVYEEVAPDLNPTLVHNEMGQSEQRAAIEAIRSRSSRVIVCVNMLGEGFDLPQLKVAALHDVHKSMAVTIQFAGRFTRQAPGLGEATIVANAADADVEEAIEDLYTKNADWDIVLRRLSEGETSRQRRRTEFLDGFQREPGSVPLQNIRPKMSMVAYRTSCDDWSPQNLSTFLEDEALLIPPTINPEQRVLLYVTRKEKDVKWGTTDSVSDVEHHLYMAYWDETRDLLYINSTNNDRLHASLAKTLAGEDASIVRGEQVYRSLHGVSRLTLSNLGLLHLLSRATQFTMHVGSDIKEGLSRAAVENRKKSNLFSRGYAGGEHVTVGASHKGRIWSHQVAEDISAWTEWCEEVGEKLLDASISTEEILEHAIIPEQLEKRPPLVPTHIEWPVSFLRRSDEAVHVEIGSVSVPFYEADLQITTFDDSGPLCFRVVADGQSAEYEIEFEGEEVRYVPRGRSQAFFRASGERRPLPKWFQEAYPTIWFEDTSKLEYNLIYRPKEDREPFNPSQITVWDWSSVDLQKESQYKACRDPQELQKQDDSVQGCVISRLLGDAGRQYDIVFDDDGTGEIADVVGLKVGGDNLFVDLFHCKYSSSSKVGARVGDFYEVCGQAQRSVYWRTSISSLFKRLKLREMRRMESYDVSRFERGDLQKLEELRRHSRVLTPSLRVFIVQPGLSKQNVTDNILNLLGATEVYLRETFDVPLGVISSS